MAPKKRLASLFVALIFVSLHILAGLPGAGARERATPPEWLHRLNEYRGAGGLLALDENGDWSAAAKLHSLYVVGNGEVTHNERPGAPWYSDAGAWAGAAGNVFATSDPYVSDAAVIDNWMMSPLHALHLLRPSLRAVGYGIWRDGNPPRGIGAAATLDVLHGSAIGSRVGRTMPYPYPGAELPITSSSGLAMCGGGPGGPVSIFFHPQNPTVTAFLVTVNGRPVPLCVVTSGNFWSPGVDPTTWRQMLAADGAVLVIPSEPVPVGATVQVGLATAEFGVTWTHYSVRGDGVVVVPQP